MSGGSGALSSSNGLKLRTRRRRRRTANTMSTAQPTAPAMAPHVAIGVTFPCTSLERLLLLPPPLDGAGGADGAATATAALTPKETRTRSAATTCTPRTDERAGSGRATRIAASSAHAVPLPPRPSGMVALAATCTLAAERRKARRHCGLKQCSSARKYVSRLLRSSAPYALRSPARVRLISTTVEGRATACEPAGSGAKGAATGRGDGGDGGDGGEGGGGGGMGDGGGGGGGGGMGSGEGGGVDSNLGGRGEGGGGCSCGGGGDGRGVMGLGGGGGMGSGEGGGEGEGGGGGGSGEGGDGGGNGEGGGDDEAVVGARQRQGMLLLHPARLRKKRRPWTLWSCETLRSSTKQPGGSAPPLLS